MSGARVLAVEPSLHDEWGIPYPAWRGRVRALRRTGVNLVAVAALVGASAAMMAALTSYADAGAGVSADERRVVSVSRTGFAWAAGIRPGQTVMSLRFSLQPDDWRLETRDASGAVFAADAANADALLRSSLPVAVAAMLMGGLAVVFLRGNRRWVTAAACIGLVAAVPSLQLAGRPDTSTVAMGAAALAPSIWLAWRPRLPFGLSVALTGLVALLVAGWAASRLLALPTYDALESVRSVAAFWGTVGVVAGSVAVPILREGQASVSRPRVGDILLVAGVAGIALGLVATLSPMVAAGIVIVAILALPTWRRWFAARAERTLLADVRDHARLEATETERAHLARELHDVPLQELAGIIRRLELLPEARAETDQLRAVAAQLRGVATELRPPVLDDLGLAPALEFLAETASTDLVGVAAEVEDLTSLEAGGRPPAEVELAIFRIAQEAVANACRHAQASHIRLRGEVGPGRVRLAVTDDGRGLDEAEASAASRRGRLGLASIRRRAEAIDAELDISGSAAGTRVAVRWAR